MTIQTYEITREHAALALFSGGLDSLLAVKHMQRLGYRVVPLFFRTPFFGPGKALQAAHANGVEVEVIDITEAHLAMMRDPRYGFGRAANPCIDCHGLMFRTAYELLPTYNAHFLISGEVLGQRPMSQRRDAMNAVGKLSGAKELLVRPLSQKLLADTRPITEGWVDKSEMLDIEGRSRKRQEELALELGVTDYHNPGGGCLLTEKGYGLRVHDLLDHNALTARQAMFLNFGRHFRLDQSCKLVVGKTNADNNGLSDLVDTELVMKAEQGPGPIGVLLYNKQPADDTLQLAASIVLRYTSKAPAQSAVLAGQNYNLTQRIETSKIDDEALDTYMIKP